MPCLLGLLSFPGACPLVTRVKVLSGATPNVDFRSFESDGHLPEVFVELRINKSLGTGDGPSRKMTIKNCVLLAIYQDVKTSLVLGRSVPMSTLRKRSTNPIWRLAPIFGQLGSCNGKTKLVVVDNGAAGRKSDGWSMNLKRAGWIGRSFAEAGIWR